MKRILIFAFFVFSIFILCNCSAENKDNGVTEYVQEQNGDFIYILNTKSRKIHCFNCYSASIIKDENISYYYNNDIDDLLDEGYTTCGNCFN